MTSRFKITVAAAALLAGTGFAYAQGTGMGHEGGAGGGASTQQSAPSSERGGAAERGARCAGAFARRARCDRVISYGVRGGSSSTRT